MLGNSLRALYIALILLMCTHTSWAVSHCALFTETCTTLNHNNCTVTFPSISPRRHGGQLSQNRVTSRRCVVEVSCASDCYSICFAINSVLRSSNPETLYNIKLKYFYSNNILIQEEPEWQNLTSVDAASRMKLDMEGKLIAGNLFVPDRKFKVRVTYDCSSELTCVLYE